MEETNHNSPRQQNPSKTLFLAELPTEFTEEQLTQHFEDCPGFKSARIRTDRNSNNVGFVEFQDEPSCENAKQKGLELDGKPINIQFSHTKPKRTGLKTRPEGKHQGNGVMNAPFVPLSDDASTTLYVEGLPPDATIREISHIFRRIQGFQSLRFVPRESKNSGSYNLCFVEYETKHQAALALNQLQGYRVDKDNHKWALNITFAKTKRKSAKDFPIFQLNKEMV